MIKKILINAIFILVVSCGFQPMLKDFDVSNLIIKKISYDGKTNLSFLLQSYLNLIEKTSSIEGLIIQLSISENLSSANKNTAGITTQEDLTILVSLDVTNQKSIYLLQDRFSESKRLDITNNLGTDETIRNIEREKLIRNIAQKIKFKLMTLTKR